MRNICPCSIFVNMVVIRRHFDGSKAAVSCHQGGATLHHIIHRGSRLGILDFPIRMIVKVNEARAHNQARAINLPDSVDLRPRLWKNQFSLRDRDITDLGTVVSLLLVKF